MKQEIQLLNVVALTVDIPKYNLFRGEIGAVVECYPNDGYECTSYYFYQSTGGGHDGRRRTLVAPDAAEIKRFSCCFPALVGRVLDVVCALAAARVNRVLGAFVRRRIQGFSKSI
jgi:hypothetical protein